MPSPTASLAADVWDIDPVLGSYRDLNTTLPRFDSAKPPNFARVAFGRGFHELLSSLRTLGVDIDMNCEIMRFIRTMMLTTTAYFAILKTYRLLCKSDFFRKFALASAETAARLPIPTEWPKIALAFAAGMMVYATYKVAYEIGEDGEFQLPSVNMADSSDRRRAARQIASAGAGMRR